MKNYQNPGLITQIMKYTKKIPLIQGMNPLNMSYKYVLFQLSKTVISLLLSVYIMSFMDAVAWYRMPRYYSANTSHILRDVGYQVIPFYCPLESPNNIQTVIITYSVVIDAIRCLSLSRGRFILQRYLHITAIIYILRSLTVGVTSYPNPNPVCSEKLNENRIFWGYEGVLYEVMNGFPTHACGNLMFSGHASSLTLLLLMEYKYDLWYRSANKKLRSVQTILKVSKTLIGYYSLISCRSHYTSDVIVGVITTTSIFIICETYFPTNKHIAKAEMIPHQTIKYIEENRGIVFGEDFNML